MDAHRPSNGLQTLLEHYWLQVIAICALVASQVFSFFSRLSGTSWIWCYALALAVAGAGVTSIFYSKLPLYRQRRFFTFGSGALPEGRRVFYRWGYRCAIFAAALLLCLMS